MELELASPVKLAELCQLQPDVAWQFTDLRQCSAVFQKSFMDAWMVCKMSSSYYANAMFSVIKNGQP